MMWAYSLLNFTHVLKPFYADAVGRNFNVAVILPERGKLIQFLIPWGMNQIKSVEK